MALLRKKLAEFDARGGDTRLILSRDEIVELIRVFLPEGTNETRLIDQVGTHLNKVADLGFVRRLRGQSDTFEVRRILKAFVDAQWLAEFDQRLGDYRQHLTQTGGGERWLKSWNSPSWTTTSWLAFVYSGWKSTTGGPSTGRCGASTSTAATRF